MELKDFVKKVVTDIDAAVTQAEKEMDRELRFNSGKDGQVVKFDIAVSADSSTARSGKAGVKVLQFAEAGGNLETQQKNSTVSRVQFGLYIGYRTKAEVAADEAAVSRSQQNQGWQGI